MVKMPSVLGKTLEEAKLELEKVKLSLGEIRYEDTNEILDDGKIIFQAVSEGQKVAAYSTEINVTVAKYEEPVVSEPDISDESIGDESIGDESIGDESIGDESIGDESIGDESIGDESIGGENSDVSTETPPSDTSVETPSDEESTGTPSPEESTETPPAEESEEVPNPWG
jgi:hypothetical protein